MNGEYEIAVIGGSGFYDMPGLEGAEERTVDTPYGRTSDTIRTGELAGRPVAFLARHGRHHSLLPGEIPQRANFWALKSLGVRAVLAVSAVGSLQEPYKPGDFVVPDQIVDRTRGSRPQTFFGGGIVVHVSLADPFCPRLRETAVEAARSAGTTVHEGGTYVTIEGPAFGTRAESHLYRLWGMGVVGMTGLPEARLAREAEICYGLVTAVTDYDSWHEAEAGVTQAMVAETMSRNVERGREIVRTVVGTLDLTTVCPDETVLDAAVATPLEHVPAGEIERLGPIMARRLGRAG